MSNGVSEFFGDLFGGLQQVGSALSPALPAVVGGLLTNEAYDRLSNIGEQSILGTTVGGVRVPGAMEIAERGQAESQFRPFTVTTPTGAMFTARMGGQPSMGQLTPLPDFPIGMVENIRDQPTGVLPPGMTERDFLARGGLVPYINPDDMSNRPLDIVRMDGTPLTPQPALERRLTGALPTQPTTGGLEVGMTLSPQEQAMQQQLFGGAGGFFGQAQMPTAAREQDIFERMRAAQRPEEQRQRLALEERLAAQGRLGTSSAAYGGATPEMLAMATAQEEARNRAMLGAMQQAQAEQAQQAGLGQQFLGASYLPQTQLLAATQPAQRMAELQQQAQLYGTGLFGETAMSGLESRMLLEQARANLLGGIGSNILAGMFTPQVTKSGTVIDPGGFGDIGSIIEGIGSGLGGLFGFGKG